MENTEIKEDKLSEIAIDLNAASKGNLDESWLTMFGSGIQMILKKMFGGSTVPVAIKGTKSQIDSFAKTIGREKKYMDTYLKHGLDNPKTYKSRYRLDQAVNKFERATGIKWPFK